MLWGSPQSLLFPILISIATIMPALLSTPAIAKNTIAIGLRTAQETTKPQRNEHTNGEPMLATNTTPIKPQIGKSKQTMVATSIFHTGVRDIIIAGTNTTACISPSKNIQPLHLKGISENGINTPAAALIPANTPMTRKLHSALAPDMSNEDWFTPSHTIGSHPAAPFDTVCHARPLRTPLR